MSKNKLTKYDASSIKVYQGLEAVRKRPGMYIGSTDVSGLHHLLWEIIDNAIDEVLSGHADKVKVVLKEDGSVVVLDNGRGIPVEKHVLGKSAIEVIFTELHAGGKFSQDTYKVAGGLHGIGASVVNALSTQLIATVYRKSQEYQTIFENGVIVKNTTKVGIKQAKGTKIHFWPDYSIFKNAQFNYERIAEKLREAAFLVSQARFTLKSDLLNKKEIFNYQNGLEEFVDFINNSKNILTDSIVVFKETKDKIELALAFQYVKGYQNTIISFVNNIKTVNGGTHEIGFKMAWTKTINDYARSQGLLKKKEKNLEGSDIREGLTAIISLRLPENMLEFAGQTKTKLTTIKVREIVEDIISRKLNYWLQETKHQGHLIVNHAKNSAKIRVLTRKARIDIRKTKSKINNAKFLSGKLTPAQTKNINERELFLVEGASAGGSAKQGRDHKTQAILPLRGKVINSERSKLDEILKNEEIITIINTLGAGIANDFDLKQLQYDKVIIMTDADMDGAHIQTLLLTFFFRYMKPLIVANKLFIALPPLYKVNFKTSGKQNSKYFWDDLELEPWTKLHKYSDIQRYKGLGEMNAEQLWTTTMNPETRTLIQVLIDDIALVERRISTLMGDKVEPRKKWINDNIIFSLEDNFLDNK